MATGFIEERERQRSSVNERMEHERTLMLIEKLGELKENGHITSDEYHRLKEQIIGDKTEMNE